MLEYNKINFLFFYFTNARTSRNLRDSHCFILYNIYYEKSICIIEQRELREIACNRVMRKMKDESQT